jgi:UDP-N-acetylmuramyl pentapeptide phosphotransferase/UDP-N-acetylglucosamine-1-phosphate transferase
MFSLLTICLFLIIIFLYIKIWNKFIHKVPTGIGILLTIPCFFYFDQNLDYIISILVISFTFIYFLDDLVEINFLWRIILQISASLIIYFHFITETNLIFILINTLIFLMLVNTLNFQDGEDLNISILLIIIFSNFYFNTNNKFTQNTSELILLFLISFSFFNFKKKFLYFGDSSCYFISIIIFLFVYSELKNEILIKSLISIVIFPIIDVIYVVIYRIFKKENLLSRNYLHLYQIIAKKTNSKLYILPNILFPLLNIFISSYFSLGTFFIVFLVISNTFILIITHLILKKFI